MMEVSRKLTRSRQDQNNLYRNENIILDGRRTSLRLEKPFWDALATLSEISGKTIPEIYNDAFEKIGDSSFSSRLRAHIVEQLNDAVRRDIIGAGPINQNTFDDLWYSDESATFGDRLAGAREAAGLSKAELAKRLGVKKATIDHWENDLTEPRANKLSMLAGVLSVSITWLLTGDSEGLASPREPDV